MSKQIIENFIAAINSHDVNAIGALMADDHKFVDAHNGAFVGKDLMVANWKNYLALFPDYKIMAETISGDDKQFAIFGFAGATYKELKSEGAHWKLPCAWKAEVKSGKVALWQVYADTSVPYSIIQKYTPVKVETDGVTGLGGVFFKSANPKDLCAWYEKHLGVKFNGSTYSAFEWREKENPDPTGTTTFAIFKEESQYFVPSASKYMFNLRVGNLEELLKRLKEEGVHVFDKVENYDYGKFGWIMDPDGNKLELWEPKNEELFEQK